MRLVGETGSIPTDPTNVDEASGLGPWSYRPVDTKYARSVKPCFVIQLCVYANLIEVVQGTPPFRIELILGDDRRLSLPTVGTHHRIVELGLPTTDARGEIHLDHLISVAMRDGEIGDLETRMEQPSAPVPVRITGTLTCRYDTS